MKKRIALFGSGTGTNARNIIQKLNHLYDFILVSNNPDRGFRSISQDFDIILLEVDRNTLTNLNLYEVDLIVLVGFLIKIPQEFIQNNPPIINIHPSLLPKYGGKGMWGDNVHMKVLENGESESGITIHFVDEDYDKGDIIFQTRCEIGKDETIDTLRGKIQKLEWEYLPTVIVDLMDQIETLKSNS